MPILTLERLREVLDYNPVTGYFRWKIRLSRRVDMDREAGTIVQNGYRYIRIDGENLLAHRLAWLWMTGNWPRDQIDHISGDRLDNRAVNLREATNAENARNGRLRNSNTSGVKGVSWDQSKGKWFAKITFNYRQIALGRFDSLDDATAAYNAAAAKLHGEFAKENSPEPLAEAEYDALMAQQNCVCAFCKKPETVISHKGEPLQLVVDRGLVDGVTRGLLCRRCKEFLFLMRDDFDDIQRMIEYIKPAPVLPANVVPLRKDNS